MPATAVSIDLKRNIALTGMMGSGKSSIGRTLARLLRRKFVDTDPLIEKKAGKSISDIFKENGEDTFREIEAKVIDEIFSQEDQSLIISLGGGAVINDDNRTYIKEKSQLVTLITDPEEIHERIKKRNHRPLLKDKQDQLTAIKEIWAERKEAYSDSHLQVITSNKSIEAVAKEIITSLKLTRSESNEMMVNIPRKNAQYPIYFKPHNQFSLKSIGVKEGGQALIVTQQPIAEHYLEEIKTQVESEGFTAHVMVIDNGEDAKNFFTFQAILAKLLKLGFERKDTLIALGGGVVGDIVGFAASTYYRGINYIQVPTTLLSMIDSSVGGKTAINVPEGKNLIGSFYQPHLVHIDVNCLNTLPETEFRSGLGELVKYTLLGGKWDYLLGIDGDSFFSYVSRNAGAITKKNQKVLKKIIEHCLQIKAHVVAEDEKENGLRMHLNLGHTFGHAIEEITEYKCFSHGEAVAIGIICSCYLGEALETIKAGFTEKVVKLMDKLHLSFTIPSNINAPEIISSFLRDKKTESGKAKFIVPKTKMGKVKIVTDIDEKILRSIIQRNRS